MDSDDAIAVIGIGCNFPGADNQEEFWQLLVNGKNHVINIPSERWNNDAFYSSDPDAKGKTYIKRRGFLKNEEGYGSKVLCPNCTIDTNRVRHRSGAIDSQLKQANTMIARSKQELGTPEVGQTVAVPIPMVDRGKGDSRNLLGRVIEVNDKGNAVVAT
ncbi:unnamed protein product [Mytilus coruscus]|uniref:Beta-ketoacyl synthase-like N-terminal domain-containing protein n=1 Tax=Mytilus coruscus TaxID=42192 RepID=A0A6J8F3P2_MYTCO|nr:unnamed protein product [Mytilus coruscus]